MTTINYQEALEQLRNALGEYIEADSAAAWSDLLYVFAATAPDKAYGEFAKTNGVQMTDDQIMEIAEEFSTGSAVLCRSGSIAFARAAIAASQSKEGS